MSAWGWALLAAAAWGIAPILEKAGLKQIAPMTGLFFRSLGVLLGFILLGFFLVKPQEIRSVDMRSAALIMAGGFLASIIGQIFFYSSLKTGEVSRVVPVSGSYPFIAFFLGVLFFGESMSAFKLLGAALIVLGVWFLKTG